MQIYILNVFEGGFLIGSMLESIFMLTCICENLLFPGGSEGTESACNVGDLGSIPGLGRSPGEGNGNPLQYSCLEKPMDGGAWWATVNGVAKSRTRLSDFTLLTSYFIAREGNGNPLQYSCLENPMDRGAWRAMVHGVTESRTRLK